MSIVIFWGKDKQKKRTDQTSVRFFIQQYWTIYPFSDKTQLTPSSPVQESY